MSLPGGPLLHLTSPPHQPTRDIQPDPENAPERGGPRALAARCGEAESACVSASLERSFWGSVALALAVGASTSPDDIPILDSGVSLPRGSQHTYIDLSSRQDVLFSVLSGRWLDVVLSPAIATHLRVIYIYIYIYKKERQHHDPRRPADALRGRRPRAALLPGALAQALALPRHPRPLPGLVLQPLAALPVPPRASLPGRPRCPPEVRQAGAHPAEPYLDCG